MLYIKKLEFKECFLWSYVALSYVAMYIKKYFGGQNSKWDWLHINEESRGLYKLIAAPLKFWTWFSLSGRVAKLSIPSKLKNISQQFLGAHGSKWDWLHINGENHRLCKLINGPIRFWIWLGSSGHVVKLSIPSKLKTICQQFLFDKTIRLHL